MFERDGEIWLIPESASAGGFDLYRASQFPDRWTHEARLVEGRLHDPTLFEYGGLLWLAAGSEAFQSSTWDALSLFYAPSLKGPWRAHAKNPVRIDARSARPAGAPWTSDGVLYRPAQDCSGGYGGKLAVQKVLDLTPETFRETTVGFISFAPNSRLLGPHTLSRGGGIEAIDIYCRASDLRTGYRRAIAL